MAIYLAPVDVAIIFGYFALVLIIGFFVRKRSKTLDDYFLAGRRLTLPIFIATLVSTWYGGLLGVGELSYRYGIVNWVTQGFFWYIVYLFFAFFLANKIRKTNLYTVADQLERFYGKKARFLGAFFNYIMVTPAPYILSIGVLFDIIFGWPLWLGILIAGGITVIYTIIGGFLADVYTDFVQFVFMCVGVALIVPFSVGKYGGWSFLTANLPASHFTLTGEWTTQMVLVWGFIALWTLVDPGFYQRCYAAKDKSMPKKGILISIGIWMLFDVCTTAAGMYARAAMPNIDPVMAYPLLADAVLPVVIKGIFWAGMFAVVMSTVDSFCLLGAMNISYDYYKKLINPKASDKTVKRITQVSILITAAIGAFIALAFKSVVAMWYTIGTIGVSALMVPMMFGFFYKGKKSANAGFFSMVFGALVSIIWLAIGWSKMADGFAVYPLGIEPMYPGLIASLLAFLIINRWSVKKDV
jgi:SSS family solute:Na+ symporter